MAKEQRLIDANDFLKALDNADADVCEEFLGGCDWGFSPKVIAELIQNVPTVDAVEVEDKKLQKAIKLLIKQYERSQNSEYVHHPVAHAFFHTWKQLDERR